MSQKGGVLQKLKQALKGFGIKAPWAVSGDWASRGGGVERSATSGVVAASGLGRRWGLGALAPLCFHSRVLLSACPPAHCLQYTGPVSTPEYLQHLPRATEYRRVAPQ